MHALDVFFNNIADVEAQHNACILALDWAISASSADAAFVRRLQQVPSPVDRGDLERCRRRLEDVCIVWLYAEFEDALRAYWEFLKKKTRPPMEVLMNSVAGKTSMPQDFLGPAHHVRQYRNDLVHRTSTVPKLSLGKCKSYLCRFLSLLPRTF